MVLTLDGVSVALLVLGVDVGVAVLVVLVHVVAVGVVLLQRGEENQSNQDGSGKSIAALAVRTNSVNHFKWSFLSLGTCESPTTYSGQFSHN